MYICVFPSHPGIYGSVIAVTLLFVSLTAAQSADISDELKPTGQVATVAIVEEDEQAPPDGQENQVQAGIPVTNIGIRADTDSGADDNITNNTRPIIEFTKENLGVIIAQYRKSGASTWIANGVSTSGGGTSGTVNLPTITAGDGDYEVEITQTTSFFNVAKVIYTFTLDTTGVTVTITETTAGTVYAYADEVTTEVKTKDNVASSACTDATSTATGWDDYTPNGTLITFSGAGRCFIFTENAGNATAAHTGAKVAGSAPSKDHDADNDNFIDITTHAQLNAIRHDLNGDGFLDSGADATEFYTAFTGSATASNLFGCESVCNGYELINDLDLDTDGDGSADSGDAYWNSGAGWNPINGFTSTFDGNGYAVDNLFISRNTTNDQGLFGSLPNGGTVRWVGVTNATVTGQHGIGALVGSTRAGSMVTTSYSTGTVTGQWAIGGLVGNNDGGTIEASYSGATVTSTSTNVGGLVGLNNRATGSVKNSYAYGAVTTAASTNDIGGLVGKNSGGTITDSYWDNTVTTSSGTGTTGATGKTTTQLQSPISYTSTDGNGATAIYTTWDDSDIDGDGTNDAPWDFGTASDYPTLSPPDTTPPILTAYRIGTGNTRTYRVRAADVSSVTGRTKDNVTSSACTTGTTTTGAGWSDYTPGEIVGTAHDTNGRCVIVTDAAGNIAKVHLSDSGTYPDDFTLDMDLSGTFEPNRDAILLYLYTNQGASASELTSFTSNGQQTAVTDAIGRINEVKDNTNTPLDMDGNGTFTANTDGAIPYLHSGQGYDATALVPFTHNRQQTTATNAITRVRGTVTPNWP